MPAPTEPITRAAPPVAMGELGAMVETGPEPADEADEAKEEVAEANEEVVGGKEEPKEEAKDPDEPALVVALADVSAPVVVAAALVGADPEAAVAAHEQTAAAEPMTARALLPHAASTQFCAAAWILEEEAGEHWQS